MHPGARILALTSDGKGPATLAELLAQTGFGPSRMTVLEALGGERERVRNASAAQFDLQSVHDLNVVAIEVMGEPAARIIARAAGLSDALFEHDGQITKRGDSCDHVVRACSATRRTLWDIGAGSGSVSIEWMLADASLRAIAIEPREERAARIRHNAASMGVPGLHVIEGTAPTALKNLPRPGAVFIGGGASDPGVIEAATQALPPGARLVINAVTLATEHLLIERHAGLGGELTRIAIARTGPLGSKNSWRPALPVTQWTWVKP